MVEDVAQDCERSCPAVDLLTHLVSIWSRAVSKVSFSDSVTDFSKMKTVEPLSSSARLGSCCAGFEDRSAPYAFPLLASVGLMS